MFRSDAQNFAAAPHGEIPNIFFRDMDTGVITRLSAPAPTSFPGPGPINQNSYSAPSISGDGALAVFSLIAENSAVVVGGYEQGQVFTANLETGAPATQLGTGTRLRVSDDGRDMFVFGGRYAGISYAGRLHVATGERSPAGDFHGLEVGMNAKPVVTIGQDARYAALVTEPSANLGPPVLYDLLYERTFALPFTGFGASFDASSRFLAIATQDALVPVGGDANNVPDIYVVDLRQVFDADADSLDDRWETTFGLSTTAGTGDDGADGPDGDPDGDGITNAQEQNAGTHPRGMHRLYLAEGATGSFFQTRLMLANDPRRTSRNPGASGLAPGLDQVIDLPPNSRTTVEIPSSLLSFKRFATLVEGVGDTPVPLVVEGAFYWSVDGLLWAAGSGVVATPLP